MISEFMDAAAVERLAARFSTLYEPALADDPSLADAVAGARALIVRNRTQVRGDLLAAAGRLECVGRLGVGLDNIDLEACRARGIEVYPATGANDVAVAEYVIAAALLLLRGAYRATDEVAAGGWPRQRLIGREAAGKTIGLVGFGATARETARRAGALGMKALGASGGGCVVVIASRGRERELSDALAALAEPMPYAVDETGVTVVPGDAGDGGASGASARAAEPSRAGA